MQSPDPSAAYDRVLERRRAVALAHRFREAEGLYIAQIAERLYRSPATIKAYFYDPTGENARAVKARYVGVCRACGAYTQPRTGKGRRVPILQAVPSGRDPAEVDAGAGTRRDAGLAEQVRQASVVLRLTAGFRRPTTDGRLPSSYDWSRTHARRRGEEAIKRLDGGEWPPASVVSERFGRWREAREIAAVEAREWG